MYNYGFKRERISNMQTTQNQQDAVLSVLEITECEKSPDPTEKNVGRIYELQINLFLYIVLTVAIICMPYCILKHQNVFINTYK